MNISEMNPLHLAVIMAGMGLIPLLFMISTAFLKIAVVLVIVRNALGVQQVPPNMVLYGIAVALTLYIMTPIFSEMQKEMSHVNLKDISSSTIAEHLERTSAPLKVFISKHSDPDVRETFVASTKELWPEEMSKEVDPEDFIILIPAFVISELQSGFEIGFLIYIPFVVIDLIVSNLLLALGMQMVAPMTVSLPFKILLFVIAEGWQKLLQSLVLSYV